MKSEKRKTKSKKISLQDIGDFYFNLGYRGEKLHTILTKDKVYQELLKNKKQGIAKKTKLAPSDKAKYALATEADLDILNQCNLLAKEKLSKDDKDVVELIKSQLLDDWRTPLLKFLNALLKRYKIK